MIYIYLPKVRTNSNEKISGGIVSNDILVRQLLDLTDGDITLRVPSCNADGALIKSITKSYFCPFDTGFFGRLSIFVSSSIDVFLRCLSDNNSYFIFTNTTIPASFVARLFNKKYFCIVRSYEEEIFFSPFLRLTVSNKIKRLISFGLMKRGIILSCGIITNSAHMRNFIEVNYSATVATVILYPPVRFDNNVGLSRSVNDGNSIKTVGFVNSGPHKGESIVVDLAARIPELTFFIFGKPLSCELSNVISFGYVMQDVMYSKIDLLLVPSLWEEPFGRVVVEAASKGVLVLGSTRGGIKELIPSDLYCLDIDVELWERRLKGLNQSISNEDLEEWSLVLNRMREIAKKSNDLLHIRTLLSSLGIPFER